MGFILMVVSIVAGLVAALSRTAKLRRQMESLENELGYLKKQIDSEKFEPLQASPVAKPTKTKAKVASPIPVVPVPVTEQPFTPAPPPLPSMESVNPSKDDSLTDPPPIEEKAVRAASAESLELNLGRVWFVRIGVVLVLTSLALLGNFAYGRLDPAIQPMVHAGVLGFISFGLLGAGLLLPRRWENLQAYGQVLTAGGLAAVYFTTYSMHFHFGFLNPLPAGGLLLVWVGFIVWLADRRRSETMALFAVGGAFYASFIPLLHGSGVAGLMLASNIVLAVASIWFLLRNRWVHLTYLSLAAVYTAFGAWRFIYAPHVAGLSHAKTLADTSLFVTALTFLLAYWVVFNIAALVSRETRLSGWPRGVLLGTNTGFLFVYLAVPLSALQASHPNTFWMLPAALGLSVLALAAATRQRFPRETASRDTLLALGLMLVTLAVMTFNFTGPHTALILATQSMVLLYVGLHRDDLLLRFGAYAAGGIGLGWALVEMAQLHAVAFQYSPVSLRLGVIVGLALAANAWMCARFRPEKPVETFDHRAAGFVAGAAVMGLAATLFNTLDGWREGTGPLLAGLALIFTGGAQILRVREMVWGGQILMLGGQAFALIHLMKYQADTPGWCPVLVACATLVQLLWWRRAEAESSHHREGWESIHALVLAGLMVAVIFAFVPDVANRLWVLPLAGMAVTALVLAGHLWRLAICCQLLPLAASLEFLKTIPLQDAPPVLLAAMVPIAGLLVLGLAAQAVVDRGIVKDRVRSSLITMIRVYLAAAAALILVCLMHSAYVAPVHRCWLAALVGLIFFAWHGVHPQRDRLMHAALFAVVALLVFWDSSLRNWTQAVTGSDLAVILTLLLQQRVARQWIHRYVIPAKVHQAVILLGTASLVVWVTRWVMGELPSGFYLTVSWALLAFGLFLAGLGLRERTYRLVGLGLLTLALVRLGVFDIWNLQDKIARSLSVLALGTVLLVLGFIYNRYQDTIRKWL